MTNMFLDPASCVEMAENATSAFRCLACSNPLPYRAERMLIAGYVEGWEYYLCSCGDESLITEVDVCVIPSSVKFLNSDVTRESVWYHATSVENWAEEVTKLRPTFVGGGNEMESVPYVHLGTLDAALERFRDKQIESGWLYELRIKDEVGLAEEVYEDQNDWEQWVRTAFYEDGEKCDVIRYVNRWESVGSISLILDPRFIEVVKVSLLSREVVTGEIIGLIAA